MSVCERASLRFRGKPPAEGGLGRLDEVSSRLKALLTELVVFFDDFLGSRSPIQSLSATFIPPIAWEASVLSLVGLDGRESEDEDDELPFSDGPSRDGRDRNTFELSRDTFEQRSVSASIDVGAHE
jgi:hypothetical protein